MFSIIYENAVFVVFLVVLLRDYGDWEKDMSKSKKWQTSLVMLVLFNAMFWDTFVLQT